MTLRWTGHRKLDRTFLEEAAGRTVYLHAMHSEVDWFAYAVWAADGTLQRSLSLAPDHGIMENIGTPLPFEEPYWAGDRPLDDDDEDEGEDLPPYPSRFIR